VLTAILRIRQEADDQAGEGKAAGAGTGDYPEWVGGERVLAGSTRHPSYALAVDKLLRMRGKRTREGYWWPRSSWQRPP